MLPTAGRPPLWMELESWWFWIPITSPLINQKNVHRLITHTTTPLTSSLGTFPWKPLGNLGLLSTSCLDYLLGTLPVNAIISLTKTPHQYIDFTVSRQWFGSVNWRESLSVMSDSLWPPWMTQSMEFSRPEYWSG